jgi:predicted N-acyltransferase
MYSIGMPGLEVRSPLGTSKGFFSRQSDHTDLLSKGLEEIQENERAKGIFILDLKKEEFGSIRNELKRYKEFPIYENTYLDLNFSDFDDYLSFLDAKTRRSIRITLKKTKKRWNIQSVVTNEFSKWKSVAHRLQGYICRQYNDYRWHLSEQFYEALDKHLKEKAELLFFFKDNVPLVFALAVNSATISQYKFVGVDPKYRDYQAYFLIYYEGIRRAIERRQKRIYFGSTAYAFKEKIGCKREALFGFAKLKNPLFDALLRSYITFYRQLGKKF